MSVNNIMFVEGIIVCWTLNKVFYETADNTPQDVGLEVLYIAILWYFKMY